MIDDYEDSRSVSALAVGEVEIFDTSVAETGLAEEAVDVVVDRKRLRDGRPVELAVASAKHRV